MNFNKEFERIMTEGVDLALATSLDNTPNVRIVLFTYDLEKKVVYVPTYLKSPKVTEIASNNKVAFTTVPVGFDAVRVSNATITKSKLSVEDIKDAFIKKFPGFQATVEHAGPMMVIYEINFNEADVIVGFNNTGKITL